MEDNIQKFVQRREKQNRKASGTSHPSPAIVAEQTLSAVNACFLPSCELAVQITQLESLKYKCHHAMTFFFASAAVPTSRKVLSTFHTFCPFGIQIVQTVVHFAHFQVQARKRGFFGVDFANFQVKARKKGVLGWVWRCFVYVHIS